MIVTSIQYSGCYVKLGLGSRVRAVRFSNPLPLGLTRIRGFGQSCGRSLVHPRGPRYAVFRAALSDLGMRYTIHVHYYLDPQSM